MSATEAYYSELERFMLVSLPAVPFEVSKWACGREVNLGSYVAFDTNRNRRLTAERKKHLNKAKVAVVSETVHWIWAIGLRVQGRAENRLDQPTYHPY